MKSNRRKQYLLWGGLFLICVILSGSIGFFTGRNQSKSSDKTAAPLITKKDTGEKTRLIAIVNQDIGVVTGDETVNYAAKLLTNMGENFTVAGLEEARTGIENGTFGAYIIIPSSFSKSVVSLNDTPQKASVEFAINPNLEEELIDKVVIDTMSFVNSINHNLSYMYVNTLLKEFHSTQDAAVKVMDNDQKDTEVILAIQPEDLVELVAVPELKQIDHNVDALDIQQYMEKNAELVDTVDGQYTQYITLSREDYEALSQQGSGLLQEWTVMDSFIGDINLTQDDEGKTLYEDGMSDAINLLTVHNQSLVNRGADISSVTKTAVTDLEQVIHLYEEQIKAYNTELSVRIDQTRQIMNLYQYPEVKLEGNQLSLCGQELNIIYQSDPWGSQPSEWEEKWKSRVSLLSDYVNGLEAYMAAQKGYITYLEANLVPEAVTQDLGDIVLPADTDRLIKSGYASTDELIDAVRNSEWTTELDRETIQLPVDLTQLQTDLKQILEQNLPSKSAFDDEVTKAADGFLEYQDKITITSDTGENQESSIKQQIQDVASGLGVNINDELIRPFETASLKDVLDKRVVAPLVNKTEAVKGTLQTQYATEKTQYLAYSDLLEAYDPLKYINQTEISKTVSDMHENGNELQKNISSHDSAQSEYVSDVYQTTGENVNLLTANIDEAKQKSEEAVRRGLSEAKAVKSENGSVNQTLLYDITQKLPYTRLGSLEYIQVYEFIANPLELIQNNAEGKTTVEVSNTVKPQKNTENKEQADSGWNDLRTVLLLTGILCIGIMSVLLGKRGRFREKSRDVWS